MNRRCFMAANVFALRHDHRRFDKSVRGVLGKGGVRS
jgi:hypothetical protein